MANGTVNRLAKIMAVGVFDLLHAGHLHYLEQARLLGSELVVVVAHDDTVRARKHEPVTNHDLRKRMVEGLKPVDRAIVGNPHQSQSTRYLMRSLQM